MTRPLRAAGPPLAKVSRLRTLNVSLVISSPAQLIRILPFLAANSQLHSSGSEIICMRLNIA